MGTSVIAQELLAELQRLKRAKPTIGYSEYWKELRKAIEKENETFVKEDEKLQVSYEMLHRPFTI